MDTSSRPRHASTRPLPLLLASAVVVSLGCSHEPNTHTHPDAASTAASGAGGDTNTGSTTSAGSTAASSSTTSAGAGGATSWLDEPGLWKPVGGPLEQSCGLYQASLPSATIPKRTWSPCGIGCSEAPPTLPGYEPAFTGAGYITAVEHAGEIYYRVSRDQKNLPGHYAIDDVTRLSDDEPVVVLRRSPTCYSHSGAFSPLLFAVKKYGKVGSPDPSPPVSIGTADPVVGAVINWSQPGIEIAYFDYFQLEHVWGFIRANSSVEVALTPGSTVTTPVFTSPAYQLHPAHRGDLLAWSDWTSWLPANRARLRIWTPDGGSKILVQGDGDVMYSAITDERIVWLEASGLQSIQGGTESETLYYSPKTADPAKVERIAGPLIPHTETTTLKLVAFGDYAAMRVTGVSGPGIVVANFVTKQVWHIPDRPGRRFVDALAINASSVFASEYPISDPSSSVDRLVRFDMSKLDELAKGWN